MAELNLKQITDKLNQEFAGDTRKLVFWYDDKAEFLEDVDSLELSNAKIIISKRIISFILNTFWNGLIEQTIT
jgi:hypothetical protein